MGVLNAMLTAVTGLSAQSYALENISGNIANSQTVGYKRVDTSFVDMIPESSQPRRENAGSVAAYSRLTNTLQGSLQTTGITTNLAINGGGYFVVRDNKGSASNPTFSGQDLYTRRGDFGPDANGYLVNGAGKYLIGSTPGKTAGPIQIDTKPVPAKLTSSIAYQANLPSYPKTTAADPSVPGSELLSATLAGSATISANDRTAFEDQSIPGGEVTVYDASGSPVVLQTRWAKVDSSASGGTDTWQLYYKGNETATGTGAVYAQIGSGFSFTPAGTLTSANSASIANLSVNGTTVGPVTLGFGSGQLTQYGDANGLASNVDIDQNGYATGSLSSISVSSEGQIVGNYSNGQVSTLAQVQVAHFQADDALKRMDGGTYAQTVASGSPSYGLQGSSLTSGSVETSNTDIAEEFSKMIVTQQAYSANTRVISTAQQMLQDVINVIR
ncbi:flagellar hook protein FlgE [Enterovirga rhinocerotis]|uniref:Flagellar hook protein FlgE n=1 Tax=Enterovirga rhinocerotis TaxID=1339210 RepID=A0A4R7BJ77_9HYPH|nr:flagellar hook-basal body complex protein [Enterovirga rhinocerotis]TDR85211.1 flagellar hook protein FlgE [Enterovirga rhinocerotis]